jgi:hypothetical protein
MTNKLTLQQDIIYYFIFIILFYFILFSFHISFLKYEVYFSGQKIDPAWKDKCG